MRGHNKNLRGFTLIELVVVVMILGILAAIAAPRLLGASNQAIDNGVRQSLSVVRNAIDQYTAEHAGVLPGADNVENTFKADIKNYLRGQDFPTCPVAAKNSAVRMVSGAGPIARDISDAANYSWVYQSGTGEFYINSNTPTNDTLTTYDQY
jgi:general secretion pathway protein G